MDLTALQTTLSTLAPLVIGVVLLWLALYILSRWSRDLTLRLLALSVGLSCLYFFQVGLLRTAYSTEAVVTWTRLLWPAVPFAPVVWLNAVLELDKERTIPLRWRRLVYEALYLVAGCLAAVAVLTEWFFRYSAIRLSPAPWQVFDLPYADGYFVMPVFLGGVLGVAAWRLFTMPRQESGPARRHFRRLAVGTVVAAVGAVSLSLDVLMGTLWPEWMGEIVLALGILLVGYSTVSYRTTLWIREDFSYTSIRTAVVSVLYLIAVVVGWLFQRPLSWALPFVVLLVLVVATHTMYDMAAGWFDRVLGLSPALRRERERSRRFYRSILLSRQQPLDLRTYSDEKLYQELRRAVSHVRDLQFLSDSPLNRLYVVFLRLNDGQLDPTPSNRAIALQHLLVEVLKEQRSPLEDGANAKSTGAANPCFETLYYKYVEPAEGEVKKRLDDMPERTLHRWQAKGCRVMAMTLRYREDEARVTLLGDEVAETGEQLADIGSNSGGLDSRE